MSEFGYSPNVRLGYTPGAPTSAAMHRERCRRGGRRSGEVRRQLRDLHGPRRLKRIRQVGRDEFERLYREMCEREELVFDRRGLNSCWCLYVSLMSRYRAQGNGYETTNAQTCKAMAARDRPRCRRTVQRLRRRLAAMGVMDFHHVKRSGAERRPGELDSLRVVLLHLRRAAANVTLRSWSEPALTGRRLRRKALSPPPSAADGKRRRCAAPNGGNEDQQRTIRELPEDRQPYTPSRLEFLSMMEELAPGLMDGAQRRELAALRAEASGSGHSTPRTASIAAEGDR